MIKIELQSCVKNVWVPSKRAIQQWVTCALKGVIEGVEICIRIVGPKQIQEINRRYRHKDKPTNVLSFPYSIEDDPEEFPQLGDILICPEVLKKEATAQHKDLEAHWAHIVVHGTLHLVGFDHQEPEETCVMQDKEEKILEELGFEIGGKDNE